MSKFSLIPEECPFCFGVVVRGVCTGCKNAFGGIRKKVVWDTMLKLSREEIRSLRSKEEEWKNGSKIRK